METFNQATKLESGLVQRVEILADGAGGTRFIVTNLMGPRGKPPAVVYWQRNETTQPDQQEQRVA